jgi:hypothetical protein
VRHCRGNATQLGVLAYPDFAPATQKAETINALSEKII